MSIASLRGRAPDPKLPRAQIPPAPPQMPARSNHDDFAEEAARAAQRYIDQVQQIAALTDDVEAWRRRALMAEAEIKRLEMREASLTNMLAQRTQELETERDGYRFKLASLVSQFDAAGAIILKCLEAAQAQAGPKINLRTLVEELERAAAASNAARQQESGQSGDGAQQADAPPAAKTAYGDGDPAEISGT